MNKKLLDNGKIPANTECPYKKQCDPKGDFCAHTGVNHTVPFSCGLARAFDIFKK